MINMKKLSAFVLTAAMMASMAVNAMAAEISPRYTACPNCGRGTVLVDTRPTWDVIDFDTTYTCVHNGMHSVDLKWWEGIETAYTCTSCGFLSKRFEATTGRWEYRPYLGYRL